jgi:hypothetical protein
LSIWAINKLNYSDRLNQHKNLISVLMRTFFIDLYIKYLFLFGEFMQKCLIDNVNHLNFRRESVFICYKFLGKISIFNKYTNRGFILHQDCMLHWDHFNYFVGYLWWWVILWCFYALVMDQLCKKLNFSFMYIV